MELVEHEMCGHIPTLTVIWEMQMGSNALVLSISGDNSIEEMSF